MRILSFATALALVAAPAMADGMKYFPYHGHNFCPAGLQPISMGGVICCGQPNTHVTYREMMRHPAPVRHQPVVYLDKGEVAGSSASVCQEGEKGC
ncbi:MAG: hypothetical protein AAGL23_13515 [Pseudomonadota bacterium]